MSTNQETEQIKNQELNEADSETKFLTDVSEGTVWSKTAKGYKCPMNLIKMLAPSYVTKLDALGDKEKIELFGFTFMYFVPKDEQGNPKQDTNKMIYRFVSQAGGSGGGGKSQFIPKRTKDVEVIPFRKKKEFLAVDPNHHWKLVGHEYHQSDIPEEREMLLIFEWVENIPR